MDSIQLTDSQQATIRLGVALLFSLLIFTVIAVAWLMLGRIDQTVALPLLISVASIWLPSPLQTPRLNTATPIVNVQMTPGAYGPNVLTTETMEPLRRGNVSGTVSGPVAPVSISENVHVPMGVDPPLTPKE